MGLWDIMVESWEEACAEVDEEYRLKNQLKPGSVIRDERDFYDHYAIYAGSKRVIHFSEGQVRVSTLAEMKDRDWGYVDVMAFEDQYVRHISPEQSLARARSCIGMMGYDLIDNNCEHFALWCRTGKAFSSQALGSSSIAYDGKGGGLFTAFVNIPRLVSLFYKDEVGMEVSRALDVELINDV